MSVDSIWIFNLLGLSSSAITAFIYEFVHQAKTIQERCIFHLSFTLALTEYLAFTNFLYFDKLTRVGVLIIFWGIALLALSSFLWSLILAFHLWKTFRPRPDENSTNSNSTSHSDESISNGLDSVLNGSESVSNGSESISNDSKLMKTYFQICYGIPFLFYLTQKFTAVDFEIQFKLMTTVIVLSILLSSMFYIHLSYRVNQLLLLHESNQEVELNMKQIKYRQQFANKLFLGLVIPWVIVSIFMIPLLTLPDDSETRITLIKIPFFMIGVQGQLLYFIVVFFRKRIWKDAEVKLGVKKPAFVINIEKSCGNISEDDDEEEIMNNRTSLDFLAVIYRMKSNGAPNRSTNLPPNPNEYSSIP